MHERKKLSHDVTCSYVVSEITAGVDNAVFHIGSFRQRVGRVVIAGVKYNAFF